MAQTFLIFDFGANEEAAQQARGKLDGWRQAFHLGKKIEYKFERKSADSAEAGGEEPSKPEASRKKSTKSAAKKSDASGNKENVRIVVRLSFSDHEKLSQQRWVERIPGEDPFKSASPEVIRHGDPGVGETSALFDRLD